MLNYGNMNMTRGQYVAPQQGTKAKAIAGALKSAIGYKVNIDKEREATAKKKKAEQDKLNKKRDISLSMDMTHGYNLDVQQVLANDNLKGNDKLQALQDVANKYLGTIAQDERAKSGESIDLKKTYYQIEEQNSKIQGQVKKNYDKEVKANQINLLKDRLATGQVKDFKQITDYNKEFNLGLSEAQLKKAFVQGRTQHAINYIESATIDGVPTELLKFKNVEQVKKAFYSGVDIDQVPTQVISAIASAHRWKISEVKRTKAEAERARRQRISDFRYQQAQEQRYEDKMQRARDKAERDRLRAEAKAEREAQKKQSEADKKREGAVTQLYNRLGYEVDRANTNGKQVDPSIQRSLSMLSGITTDPTKKDKIDNLDKVIQDNQNITTLVRTKISEGKSKDEIFNSLAGYTTVSKKDKTALANKVINNYTNELEDMYSQALSSGDLTQTGKVLTTLYKLDSNEGRKVAQESINKQLNLLTTDSIDDTMNALTVYISSEINGGHPKPLLEQKLLNELENTKMLIGAKEPKQDINSYLFTKKREFSEAKRTSNKKQIGERVQAIQEQLNDKWLEFDNTAYKKDMYNFILDNPHIPTDKLGDAYERESIDIDTSNTLPLIGEDFGNFKLSQTLQNGKLLIPNDREKGKDSIAPFLKQYIPKNSDKFTKWVISKTQTNLKELELQYNGKFQEIDDFKYMFVKTPNGLQLQAYGTPKGWDSEELLGIVNHDELKKYLDEVR